MFTITRLRLASAFFVVSIYEFVSVLMATHVLEEQQRQLGLRVMAGGGADDEKQRTDLLSNVLEPERMRSSLVAQLEKKEFERQGLVRAIADDGAEKTKHQQPHSSTNDDDRHASSTRDTIVPFVYMVYNRVDYLKRAIESLKRSDYPRERVPLIISHDGRVPEVVKYVETIKKDFDVVIQLFHPYSCYEHPTSFPGKNETLNVGYKGDTYGHPRSSWATCCKHHFTWMINEVFRLEFADTFLFMEEDYIVAPSVYQAIISGLNVMEESNNIGEDKVVPGGILGLVMDRTNGGIKKGPATSAHQDAWTTARFQTGPMTLSRTMFQKLKTHSNDFCTYDDYNWDWSLLHLGEKQYLPSTVLLPGRSLVKHIGTAVGMHIKQLKKQLGAAAADTASKDEEFNTVWTGDQLMNVRPRRAKKLTPNGGWGHPTDHEHCVKLFSGPTSTIQSETS